MQSILIELDAYFTRHPILFLSLCCLMLCAIGAIISHHTLRVF